MTGEPSLENSSPFSTSSSRIRSAATRFSVASIGRPGVSTRTRSETRATSWATSTTSVYSVRPASTTPSSRETSRCEALGAHHEGAEHLLALLARPGPLGQGLRHPEDHGDGRAELVAEPAHELVTTGSPLEERLLRELELPGAASLALEGLGELADHAGRDLGRDHPAARGRLADRVEDLVAVGVLQDVAGGARRRASRGRRPGRPRRSAPRCPPRGTSTSGGGSPRSRSSRACGRPSARRRARSSGRDRPRPRLGRPRRPRAAPRSRGATRGSRGTPGCRRRRPP